MHLRFQPSGWKITAKIVLLCVCLLLSACGGSGGSGGSTTSTPTARTQTIPIPTTPPLSSSSTVTTCPGILSSFPDCQTPQSMRIAYGMEALTERGFTGKGQTVVDIVSYGSPTLQQDINVFDQQFGLPSITLQVVSPLGTVPFNAQDQDMLGWASETTLDVEIIHAMAPQAGIVVMTSPVDETEGTIGLPEFLQLEQYAAQHNLGQVFSQSYVASETTLADSAGRQLVNTYTNFYQQITTQQGWTVLSGSGDHGATDFSNIAATRLSPTPIVNFPADVPWVTAVGGTTLAHAANGYNETAWNESGGGFSKFFSEPDFLKSMPAAVQAQLQGKRGLPDVAGDANPATAMAIYFNGRWQQIGGTSASTPLWAGIIAVADQMAGHALGFINAGLYKVAMSANARQDFRDITTGNNSYGEGSMEVTGYAATEGWDAVTGWGSPIAEKLLPDLIAALKS
jgi:subtilase family serine protease